METRSDIGALPDDTVLTLPAANVRPGDLSRLYSLRASRFQQTEFQAGQRQHETMQLRDEQNRKQEGEHRELKRREAELLRQLDEREREIERELKDIDDRAIKLTDGRRAYVDGDTYRDGQGRELTGADRAEAEQLHLENPNAATWQEKHNADQEWQQTHKLKERLAAPYLQL